MVYLALSRASKDYFHAGGPPYYHVMKDERCSIVLSMCLYGWQSHFVGYDGSIIHDAPHSLKISRADRSTKESSRAAFDKLFLRSSPLEDQLGASVDDRAQYRLE